jgi:hypothetical protein
MGIMFAMKCDLCGGVQVKEKPHEIKGSTHNEGGTTKFTCVGCEERLKAAFELKKKGLKDPLKKVAGLIKERDQARREADEAKAALAGENPFAALAIGNPKAALGVKGIPTAPMIGMTKKPMETTPHPDQPKTKTRKLRGK